MGPGVRLCRKRFASEKRSSLLSPAVSDANLFRQEGKFAPFQRVTHDAAYFVSVAARHLASFLENDDRFCVGYAEDCAIYPRKVECKTSKEEATRCQYYKTFCRRFFHHSMVILSFYVTKLYYPENHCRLAVITTVF